VDVKLARRMTTCAAGGHHTLLLSEQGHVFSFGSNSDGQLGRFVRPVAAAVGPTVVTPGAPAAAGGGPGLGASA
jgi:hypothetical protein